MQPCEQAENIRDIEKRLAAGEVRFTKVEGTIAKVLEVSQATSATINKVDKRLFVDNGTISVQTRLDRHDNILRVAVWLASLAITGIFGLVLREIVQVVTHVHGG